LTHLKQSNSFQTCGNRIILAKRMLQCKNDVFVDIYPRIVDMRYILLRNDIERYRVATSSMFENWSFRAISMSPSRFLTKIRTLAHSGMELHRSLLELSCIIIHLTTD